MKGLQRARHLIRVHVEDIDARETILNTLNALIQRVWDIEDTESQRIAKLHAQMLAMTDAIVRTTETIYTQRAEIHRLENQMAVLQSELDRLAREEVA